MTLMTGPPQCPGFPQYSPQEGENAEKRERKRKEAQAGMKALISKVQQWKLAKRLPDATH